MSEGTISYAAADGVYFIRMQGRVRQVLAGGFDWLYQRLTADPNVRNVVVDLAGITYADSTAFGMLAKIARFHLERFGVKPLLICSNPEVSTIIDSMGFDAVFHIVDHWDEQEPTFRPLPGAAFTPPDAGMLWEAHNALSDMNEANKVEFADVMELLEKER
jgi:anti-anti-sigma factor